MVKSQVETRNQFSWVKNAAIAIVALAVIVAMQIFLPPERSPLNERISVDISDLRREERQEALRLQVLKKSPTFGFDNLIADWTFLQFLEYFGDDDVRNQIGYSLSADYFDVVTKLDPRWVDIYLFVSNSLSIYEGKPDVAVEYMTRGTDALSPEVHPQAWLVWRYKGIDKLLLLGDIPGAIRSHEMAAEWVKETRDRSLAPLFQQTAEFLRQDPDSKLIKFNTWLWVYYQTRDERVRDRATQELLSLGALKEEDEEGRVRFTLPETDVFSPTEEKK